MRRVKIICLAMMAVVMVSAVATSGASAAFNKVWEVSECKKEATKTFLWTDSKCSVDSPKKEGEWEILWKAVGATPVLVDSSGELTLSSGGTTVVCKGDDHGTVEEKGKDLVTSVTVLSCHVTVAGFCETLVKVEPLNLPWKTQLVEVEGKLRDLLSKGGVGNPGWGVECETFLGNKDAKCTAADGTTAITNNVPEDVVESTFDSKTEKAKCEGGTSNTGEVLGTVTFLGLNSSGEMVWLRTS